MANRVILNVDVNEVGLVYETDNRESTPMDQLRAMELALHDLAVRVMMLRQHLEMRVPAIYAALHESRAYLEVQ